MTFWLVCVIVVFSGLGEPAKGKRIALGRKGYNGCYGTLAEIKNENECRQAASELKKDFIEVKDWSAYPRGCYFYYLDQEISKDFNGVYYNEHKEGTAHNLATPICYEYRCVFKDGDGLPVSGYGRHGESSDYEKTGLECVSKCVEEKNKGTTKINGVTIRKSGNAGCWCEYNMKRIANPTGLYKTCYLEEDW